MNNIRLLYRSTTSSIEFDPLDLDILKTSIRNNARDQITGFLARSGEQFFQALEGPEDRVHALVQRLSKDTRHDSVEVLLCKPLHGDRSFTDWSMGYDYLVYDQFDLALDDDGGRPAVSDDVAEAIMASLAEQAREVLLYGSIFPYSRRQGETEHAFMNRLEAI